MGQVSDKLRRTVNGYAHWCPGCEELHMIPDSWIFDGNLESPTFAPSVKITGVQTVIKDGEWTGEWVKDESGKALPYCCHYFLQMGKIVFCSDCTHKLAGQTMDLPSLPVHARDP